MLQPFHPASKATERDHFVHFLVTSFLKGVTQHKAVVGSTAPQFIPGAAHSEVSPFQAKSPNLSYGVIH